MNTQEIDQHNYEMEGNKYAVYNPKNLDVRELPTIYGFNNGGSQGFYDAVLISEDGEFLGGHLCSDECYMYYDLGILEGTSPDRHKTFKEYYPDGYKMYFVSYLEVMKHEGLKKAIELAKTKKIEG